MLILKQGCGGLCLNCLPNFNKTVFVVCSLLRSWLADCQMSRILNLVIVVPWQLLSWSIWYQNWFLHRQRSIWKNQWKKNGFQIFLQSKYWLFLHTNQANPNPNPPPHFTAVMKWSLVSIFKLITTTKTIVGNIANDKWCRDQEWHIWRPCTQFLLAYILITHDQDFWKFQS